MEQRACGGLWCRYLFFSFLSFLSFWAGTCHRVSVSFFASIFVFMRNGDLDLGQGRGVAWHTIIWHPGIHTSAVRVFLYIYIQNRHHGTLGITETRDIMAMI